MAIKPTAAQIIAEGQLKIEYFPTVLTPQDFTAFIEGVIDVADAETQLRIGDANYETTDARKILLFNHAEIDMIMGRLWDIILNVMLAYDDESLPPEYVDPGACADKRDFYLKEGDRLLATYEPAPTEAGQTLPFFGVMGGNHHHGCHHEH